MTLDHFLTLQRKNQIAVGGETDGPTSARWRAAALFNLRALAGGIDTGMFCLAIDLL